MRQPRVTVFIPIYNGEAFIANAIDSILNQEFDDFELLIIDDGSSDRSASIIQTYEDNRIRFLRNETNKGISFTRNRAIAEARGEYLAFLDADDISTPQRLKAQVHYLDTNLEIVACGSHATGINTEGQIMGEFLRVPINIVEIKARLAFQNVFVNSTLMFRTNILRKMEGYYDGLCEDYDMAIQLNRNYFLANLDESFVKYRFHNTNTSSVFSEKMHLGEQYVIGRIHRQLGIEEDPNLVAVHHSLIMANSNNNRYLIDDYKRLFIKLKTANQKKRIYPDIYFNKMLFLFWYDKIQQLGKRRAIVLFFNRYLFAWDYATSKMFKKAFKQTFYRKK